MEISFFVSWLSTIATTMLQNCQAGNKRRSSAFHQIGTLARATSCIDVYIHISGSDDGCIRLQNESMFIYTISVRPTLQRGDTVKRNKNTGRIRDKSRASKSAFVENVSFRRF